MVKKLKRFALSYCQGAAIAAVVILLVCPLSCKLTAEGIDIIKGDYSSPKMSECLVLDDKHIELNFSENVDVKCVSISKKDDISRGVSEISFPENSLGFSITGNDNNGKIVIGLDNSTEIGTSYIIAGVVEDSAGNSLTFSSPFSGYNSNIPKMIITEVHPECAKAGSSGNFYRCEYVEFMSLEDGNLYGLVAGSATNGPELDYYFPPIDVKKGEVIVVHMRIKGDGCISEEGDNLAQAFSPLCENNVRDFWINNTSSALSDSYDAIYLKDNINNKYLDGFMYHKKEKTEWSDEISKIVNELVEDGVFLSSNILDSCEKISVSSTKAFIRNNISDIVLNAENAVQSGEDIVIPPFSKDHWGIASTDAGKI